ncbi:MAG: hypothetical protein ACYC2Z_08160 [Candidatus Nanopelagicales bacterium]
MMSCAGHSAIAVGATKGIAQSMADLLAQRGANATVVGRSVDLGEQVAANC